MRLQLTVCAACLAALIGTTQAQDAEPGEGTATSRLLVYDDDDATTVVTSMLDAQATLPGTVSVGAYTVLDAVSSASVDVVSAATERWDETRVELGARAGVPWLGSNFSLAGARSQENDWLSHSVSLGSTREFFERNTLVSVGYGFTSNQIGRAADPSFERSLSSHSISLAVGQLLDGRTRGGLSYDFQRLFGYQSSPYRYVQASDGSVVAERHPTKRLRQAISGFLLRSVTDSMSLRMDYRLYRDDWGIWSHTAALRLAYELSRSFRAGLEGRFYNQNKADFYRGTYPASFRYMSSDRELASFWDLGGSAELAAEFGPVTLDAKFGAIYYRFRNFPALPERLALLVGAGAKVEW